MHTSTSADWVQRVLWVDLSLGEIDLCVDPDSGPGVGARRWGSCRVMCQYASGALSIDTMSVDRFIQHMMFCELFWSDSGETCEIIHCQTRQSRGNLWFFGANLF
jgi:hypothetical protein